MRGLKLVRDGGFLPPVPAPLYDSGAFYQTIREAAGSVHKRLRQVEYRTQAADHPILLYR